MISLLAGGLPLLNSLTCLGRAAEGQHKKMGVCTNSFDIHWKAGRDQHPLARFKDPLEFLDYCHQLGAGGVQVSLRAKEPEFAARFRTKRESHGMFFEGTMALPQREADVARFEAELRLNQEAGAAVVRTAMLSGRRYETFDTAEAFRAFKERSWQSLVLAEPVVRKHRIFLAVENHKDWHPLELVEIIKRLNSEFVGVCVDTGNNLALLDDPMEVVETLAPLAFSTHLKDMAVQEYPDGFLLSEVPLGEGFLDLKRMVDCLQKAHPKLQFNLEMITRDPLQIPCLTPKYWATMENLPARNLAGALARVRKNAAAQPLPRVTGLDVAHQLALEEENVRKSITYAHQHLL